ncbi:hypothetical protein ACFY5J_02795 [Peribacillus butanolivorans]|nr:hypothetical protein [Peribacillus butanolivorans]
MYHAYVEPALFICLELYYQEGVGIEVDSKVIKLIFDKLRVSFITIIMV